MRGRKTRDPMSFTDQVKTKATEKYWGLTTPSKEYTLYQELAFATQEFHIRVYYAAPEKIKKHWDIGGFTTDHDIFLNKDVSELQKKVDAICIAHRMGLNGNIKG